MSSSRRVLARRLAGILAALSLAGLAACGFQPLYGSGGPANEGASAELAAVRIEPLRDRVGQQMHNFLRDRLNPGGQPIAPDYRLRVRLTETVTELGVLRDETASRANLKLVADFSLLPFDADAPLFSGQSSSTTSYDILSNPFATTVSEDDARERALREVADDIQTRLALYFQR